MENKVVSSENFNIVRTSSCGSLQNSVNVGSKKSSMEPQAFRAMGMCLALGQGSVFLYLSDISDVEELFHIYGNYSNFIIIFNICLSPWQSGDLISPRCVFSHKSQG